MLCVFESVRPFKKHSEVLTNPIVVFTEIHWQWKTGFQLYNNNFFYSYTLKVKHFNVYFHFLFSDSKTLHEYLFAFLGLLVTRWGDAGPVNYII